jgi:protein tyrosine phosphatase (PTP) superfamily phosphohydrolase (DUF442 family)
MASTDIYNYIKVDDEIVTGGQPTAEQLESLAAEGFKAVINLAPVDPARSPQDEGGLVLSLGLAYFHIAVDWENPKESDFAEFERAMQQLPVGKTLIHCMANYRVTAFYSLYARRHLGWSATRAKAFRARIWEGSDYPIWQEFIARMEARSSSEATGG